MNIVLCGMMGCGKTTIAGALNRLYSFTVVDTDAVIVERYGEISAIFKERGEEYFRGIESAVVEETVKKFNSSVISLGGGCVLRKKNVERLKTNGKIFYLRTRADTIIKRLRGDTTRPLLKDGLEERVNSILFARQKIYEAAADVVIDTDGYTPEQLAKLIKESL